MCGRYKQTMSAAALGAAFHAVVDASFADDPRLDRPRYNAAPTNLLPILRMFDGRLTLRPSRWGLIPPWAKEEAIGHSLINARSETAAEKPAFKDALRRRRCLVPVDGFYEWKTERKKKQPFLFSSVERENLALAALWSSWKGPHFVVETFTLLTTTANDMVRPFHDRMPVILQEKEYDEWLDPQRETVSLAAFAAPRDVPGFCVRAVSRRLGQVRNDDPSLLVPDDDAAGMLF
jgi:putative SOS response-associated peptidase YedK